MTQAELMALMEHFTKQQEEKTKELLWVTWNTAALIRVETMPEYEAWMKITKENPKEQTDEQMMAMARMLNAAFGGEVVYI